MMKNAMHAMSEFKEPIRAKRIRNTRNVINKQMKINKDLGINYMDNLTPGKFAKMHATNCGDSGCAMCGNPRKFYKQKTI
jgi:hypothetical protein